MALAELPKYQSIANDLRSRIDDAEFAPGERLPSQTALAADYGVTLMTLRQALAALEAEGRVRALKGKGTFVSEPQTVRYELGHLSSFAEEMASQGLDVETDLLSISHLDPGLVPEVRTALDAEAHDLVELLRLRTVEGEPVILQRSFVLAEHWERVVATGHSHAPLYDAMASTCGFEVDRASETIRAVTVSTDDAVLLGLAAGSPCLESTRVSRTAEGLPFLYDRALLSGPATEIRTERTSISSRLAVQAQIPSD